jgi:hypothetical protein
MKLPIPLPLGKKDKSEYLLALLLRDEKASAVILKEIDGKVKVISKHEEYFSSSLEDAELDEWLSVLDKTISRAEETLPTDTQTEKTVFGVKETWVDDKRIKKDYLLKLKKVCDGLSLQPVGFLVIPEAIAHLMQEEEGAPVTAIFAEIGKKSVTAYYVRAGRIIDNKSSVIVDSPAKTLDALLKQFTDVEVLPARIVVYNGDRDDELAQDFVAHQWSKSLPFLHVPQISVLPVGFDAKAVVYGAAEQMGLEVLGQLASVASEIKTFEKGRHGKPEQVEPEKVSEEGETNEEDSEENFGFTVEEDIKPVKKSTPASPEPDITSVPADNFGFVMEKDVAASNPEKAIAVEEKSHKEETSQDESEDKKSSLPHKAKIHHYADKVSQEEYAFSRDTDEEPTRPSRNRTSQKSNGYFTGILASLSSLKNSLPLGNIRPPGRIPLAGKNMIILPAVLLVLIALILLYIFQLRATVTIAVSPKIIEEKEPISFSATSPTDLNNNVIAAKLVTVTQQGETTLNASGKKEVGTKAKGKVTIFNSGETSKQLSSGTTITSTNNLEFTLDKDVSIASASGDIFSGTKPGTAQVDVTAKNIGTEYNLPSNTKFSIGGSSSIAARNDSAFSGGTKKTVTVVSKKDHERLTADLPKTLEDKAVDEAKKKAVNGDQLLASIINTTMAKPNFDKKIDDEAKEVTLKAAVDFDFLSYQDDELKQFANSLIKDSYSDDLTIADNGLTTLIDNIKVESDKEVNGELTIKARLLPKIDTEKVQQELAGKSFSEAQSYLDRLPQVQASEINLTPPLPFLGFLPRMSQNISIVVETR